MAESTPFEIRADMLHLAKSILSENAHMTLSVVTSGVQKCPKFSTEEIIEEAKKLYAFVSKRS